jgi:SNF-related kinase
MSPQALAHNQYSEKSDIWALGVTVYELLLGKVPWSATSEKELVRNMVTIPPLLDSSMS